MTDKPLCRAFVSSTYIDLKGHRGRVINALRKSGIHVDPMEDWTADDREPKQFSRQRVAGCRLCILLVAFRRGYVPEGETLSITQMEYNHAIRSGVTVLPFLLGDDEPWPRRFDEMEKDPGIRQWREQLRRDGAGGWPDDGRLPSPARPAGAGFGTAHRTAGTVHAGQDARWGRLGYDLARAGQRPQ